MKKIFLGLGLGLIAALSQAQTRLENVLVEKYHVATAADAAAHPGLLEGAVTYRIYVDMNNTNGSKLNMIYSDDNHGLFFKTTTSFYNDLTTGGMVGDQVNSSSVYDSYITISGAVASNKLGVYQGADITATADKTDAIGFTVAADGSDDPTVLNSLANAFNSNSPLNNIDYPATNSVAYYDHVTGKSVAGPTSDNRVLIGQFTTTGIFSYSISLILTDATSDNPEAWVASDGTINANGLVENVNAKLAGTFAPNTAPTVALVNASTIINLTSGVPTAPVTLTATATDLVSSGFNGAPAVSKVEYFKGVTSLGVGTGANFTLAATLPAGANVITAVATDNDGASTTSVPITIQVNLANIAPTVTLASTATAVNLATPITLTATAADVDGAIASLEFFDGANSLGAASLVATKTISAVLAGSHSYTVKAIDDKGAASISVPALVTATNAKPTISIAALPTTSVKEGASVTITATTGDVDGTVTKVEFFEGTTSLGTVSPLVISTLAVGSHTITAVATDNATETTTSNAVTVTVVARIAPTVSLASSASSVNLATPITLTATTVNNDGTIASLEFFDGSTSLGAASLVATKTITAVPAGSHSYTVKAIDDKSAVIISTPALVTATNATPTISAITAPSAINAGATATLSVTAADVDGNYTVEFFNGSTSIGTVNPLVISTLPVGTLTITAVATDDKGASVTSAAKTIVVNALPTITGVVLTNAAGEELTKISEGDEIVIKVRVSNPSTIDTIVLKQGSNKWKYLASTGALKSAPVAAGTYNFATGTFDFVWTATTGVANFTADVVTSTGGTTTTSFAATTAGGVVFAPTVAASNPYTIEDLAVACNKSDFIDVPVVKNTISTGLTGFDIVLNYDASKVVPTGQITINDQLMYHLYVGNTVNYNNVTGEMHISIYQNGQSTTTFDGAGLVASVKFAKTAKFASVDTVLFTGSLVESYPTTTVPASIKTGKVTTYKNNVFTGSLKFWADNKAIDGTTGPTTTVNINGMNTPVSSEGLFTVTTTTNSPLTISSVYGDEIDVMPVINGYDAYLTSLVAVEDPRFTPSVAQIIAMDVNLDGQIAAGDISQINQRTVKALPNFVQVGTVNKDWLYVDSLALATVAEYQISTVYPKSDGNGYSKSTVPAVPASFSINAGQCAFSNELAYVGILLGDANGNFKKITHASNPSLKSDVVAPAETASVVFDYAKATVSTVDGVKYLDVPVVVSSDLTVSSLDFALNYDVTNLQYNSIVSTDAAIKTLAKVGDDNTLRFTSYSLTGFATGVTVVSVRFELKSDVVAAPISSTKAYVNGEPVASNVSANVHGIDATVLTANVYPNPAKDILNVIVSQTSNIEVINVLTQTVYTLENAAPNQINVINTSSFAKGAYYVKVTSASSSVTKVIAVQ